MKLPAVGLGADLNYLNTMSSLTTGTGYAKTSGTPADSGTSNKASTPSRSYGPGTMNNGAERTGTISIRNTSDTGDGAGMYLYGMTDLNNADASIFQDIELRRGRFTAQSAHDKANDIIEALKSNDIDPESKREIVEMYRTNATNNNNPTGNPAIAQKIADARAGKGLYGVRKVNFKEAAYMQDMPGRSQIVSTGKGKVLGKN